MEYRKDMDMAEDNKNLKGVYNTLKKEGYTPPDYEVFKTDMRDEGNLMDLYNTLKKEGYTPPDYEVFRMDMRQLDAGDSPLGTEVSGGERTGEGASGTGDIAPIASVASVVPVARKRPGLRDKVDKPLFGAVEDMPWMKNDEGGERGMLSAGGLGGRLEKAFDEGGMEAFRHRGEDERIREMYIPKDEKSEEDVVENSIARFSLTDRGLNLQRELADIRKEKMGRLFEEFKNSGEYRSAIAEGNMSGKGKENEAKAVEELFFQRYGDEMDKEMLPYMQAYREEAFKRDAVNLNAGLKKAGRETTENKLDLLAKETDSLLEERKKKREEFVALRGGYGSFTPGLNPLAQKYAKMDKAPLDEMDRDEMALRAAGKLLGESRDIIAEAKKKGHTSFAGGAARGIRDNFDFADLASMGVTGFVDTKYLNNALEKSEKGEALSPGEEKLLEASAMNMVVKGYFGSDLGRGYRAGESTADSFLFMAGFLVNPVAGSGNALAKGLLRFGLKKFGRVALSKAGKVAAKVAGKSAAAIGMEGSTGIPGLAKETLERLNANYETGFDDEGNVRTEKVGNVGAGEALARAGVSKFLDYQSEMMGDMLVGGVKNIGKAIGSQIPGLAGKRGKEALAMIPGMSGKTGRKLTEIYGKIRNNDFLKKASERAQFNGIFGEWLEEVYQNAASVATGDMSAEDAVSLDRNVDTFLGLVPTSLAFSFLGLGGLVAEGKSARGRLRKAVEKMDNKERKALGAILGEVEKGNDGEAKAFVKSTLSDASMSEDEKKERVFAVRDMIASRDAEKAAANAGNSLAEGPGDGSAGGSAEAMAESEPAVESGSAEVPEGSGVWSGNAEDKVNVYRGFKRAERRVEQALPGVRAEELAGVADAGKFAAEKGMDAGQEKAVAEYVQAREKFNGYISELNERRKDAMADARKRAAEDAEKVMNAGSGLVVQAERKFGKGTVYVTEGDLAFGDDGLLDRDRSSETVYYLDENGAKHPAAAEDFERVVSRVSADELAREAGKAADKDLLDREEGELASPDLPEPEGSVFVKDGRSFMVEGVSEDNPGYLKIAEIDGNGGVKSEGEAGEISVDEYYAAKEAEMWGETGQNQGKEEEDKGNEAGEEAHDMEEDDAGNEAAEDEAADMDGGMRADENKSDEDGDGGDRGPAGADAETGGAEPAETGRGESGQEDAIPADSKGRLLYHKVPVEVTLDYLDKEDLEPEEVDDFVKANRKSADGLVAGLAAKKPKMGTDIAEYKAKKREWQEKVADARAQADYWGRVDEGVADLRARERSVQVPEQEPVKEPVPEMMPDEGTAVNPMVIPVVKERKKRKRKTEPVPRGGYLWDMDEAMSGEELAAMMMPMLLRADYKKHTGYGEREARGMFGLFRTKANGGVGIERAGEIVALRDEELYGGRFFDGDSMAATDAILHVLSQVRTFGDLRKYVARSREVMEEEQEEYLRDSYEVWCEENFHMTADERDAYEEVVDEIIREKIPPEEVVVELYNNFADELNDFNHGRISRETAVDDRGGDTAGGESGEGLLHPEQVDKAGGAEGYQSAKAGVRDDNPGLPAQEGAPGEGGSGESPRGEGGSGESAPGEVEEEPGYGLRRRVEEASRDASEGGRRRGSGEEVNRRGEAEYSVDTNPTEAQKKAGNYRKGHVRIDGYEITIENPQGSVRSGVDGEGKAWSVTMKNSYGYIRGTEGADGDRIDVFLSDDPEGGRVYVVDQVKEDGSFDEHKVMYGFASEEAAREAYLANHSPGWKGLGDITGVSKEAFGKWVKRLRSGDDSSAWKTKPFAEYWEVVLANPGDPDSIEDVRRLFAEMEERDAEAELAGGWTEADARHQWEALVDGLGWIEAEWERKIDDYNDEHHPLWGRDREDHPAEWEKQQKAMRKDKTLKKMEADGDAEFKEADKKAMAFYWKHVFPYEHDEASEIMRKRGLDKDADTRFREKDSYGKEEQSIIEKAKEDGSYMKAPNGKKTNLTDRQWVQVRTKAFKRWFGDWEKAGRIEKLHKSNPVKITGEEYRGKYELNRESAQKYILDNLRGEYIINETGDKVRVSKKGAKKVTSHSQGNEAHMKSIAAIPELLKNAIFIEERPAYKDKAQYDAYRYYVTGLKIGSEVYTARITIGVKDGKFYYDHYLTDIEKGNLIKVAQSFTPTEDAPNPSYAGNKDSVLFSLLQTNSSKVVDKNGEPLVVYHGTLSKNIERFRKDMIGSRYSYDESGFFFIDKESIAKDYSVSEFNSTVKGEIIPVFLNVRKPIAADNKWAVKNGLGNALKDMDSIEFWDNYQSFMLDEIEGKKADGAIVNDGSSKMIVVFEPNHIKSATENIGEFSSSNDAIRLRKNSENSDDLDAGKVVSAIDKLSDALHTPVKVVSDVDEITHENKRLQSRMRKSKGWFDPNTGEVVIVVPNASSIADIQATVLHEVVGHKGLRGLFGEEEYDGMMERLHGLLPEEVRDEVSEAARMRYGGKIAVAMDEYLAEQAEKDEVPSWWGKVVAAVRGFFRDMGVDMELGADDVRYLLWKSRNRLAGGDGVLDTVRKVAADRGMKVRLRVGETEDPVRFREDAGGKAAEASDGTMERYEDELKRKAFKAVEAYQDSMLALKKLQEVVVEKSGKELRSFEDAYTAENHLSSRNAADVEDYRQHFVMPMLAEIARLKGEGASYEEVTKYAFAKLRVAGLSPVFRSIDNKAIT